MSEHEERALAEAYALGSLDPADRKRFEAHLGTCRVCRESVGGASVAVNSIGLTAPKEKPPKGSGDRLVALYRDQQAGGGGESPPSRGSGGGGLGNTLAAVFAIAGLGALGWGWHERDKVLELDQKVSALEQQGKALQQQIDRCQSDKEILNAPDLSLKADWKRESGYAGNLPTIAYSPKKGVAVLANGLPEPASGKVYKLWLVADGKVSPMGAFHPGVFIDKSPGRPASEVKFAISEEDKPDTDKPTRVILLPA